MGKRYFWLKLKSDFFADKRIKKLRKIAGGDTYTIIYLKMMLKSLNNDGILEYEGIEDSFADELSLDLDEDADNVQITINYLMQSGLLEDIGENKYILPSVTENTGSEDSSAKRVRAYRQRQKTLQCNNSVTEVKRIGNVEIEKEIEKDKEKDIEKDKEREINKYRQKEKENTTEQKTKKFIPPKLEEVKAYCAERRNGIDAEYFIDYYEARNWELTKGRKVKDWKACIRTWEKNNYSKGKSNIEIDNKFRSFLAQNEVVDFGI